jgi:AcrR family transcriptional regulator
VYPSKVPKLWDATIDEHRRQVRDAILDTTSALVAERGLLSVSMSTIAQQTGIGRATLYKYFPDVEAILSAWHERQVTGHLTTLAALQAGAGQARDRLQAMATAYARICQMRARHGAQDIGPLLHLSEHVARAEEELHALFRDVLSEARAAGEVRDDAPAEELANFCLHALGAAGGLGSDDDAVRRLVDVTLDAVAAR